MFDYEDYLDNKLAIYEDSSVGDTVKGVGAILASIGAIIGVCWLSVKAIEAEEEMYTNPENLDKLKKDLQECETELRTLQSVKLVMTDPEEKARISNRISALRARVNRLQGYLNTQTDNIIKQHEAKIKELEKKKGVLAKIKEKLGGSVKTESSYEDYLDDKLAIYEAYYDGEIDEDEKDILLESIEY